MLIDSNVIFDLLILITISAVLIAVVSSMRRGSATSALVQSLAFQMNEMQQQLSRLGQQLEGDLHRERDDILKAVLQSGEGLQLRLHEGIKLQQDQVRMMTEQLQHLTMSTEQRLERIRETVQLRMETLQQETGRHLDAIRGTVDEKLQVTLEKRIGESFRLVSERLEQVQKGLGEMQSLAVGVGDLKRVLTNVKVRGTYGEVQLQSLLEQILTPEQFGLNREVVPDSNRRVECAIRLPGLESGSPVWLPIDAKFPQEAYLRIVEAQEHGRSESVEEGLRDLERAIKAAALDISSKYIAPPHTTDFAIMFLPTEGLYAEVIRRPGLVDELQQRYKVIPAGPTTVAALLNALQIGFRTVAIERRSAEVWQLLGAVRTEFSRFAELLDKTRKKLQEAGNSIESAAVRTRQMERKLRHVQTLPDQQAATLLSLPQEEHDE